MALWDTAYLVRRFDATVRLPAANELPPQEKYDLLSEAQEMVVDELAVHVPEMMYGPPTKLTTADGGISYTFGIDADGTPIVPRGHVEVRPSPTGDLYTPATQFDAGGDFVI